MNITSIVAKKCSQVNKKQKINESIAFVSSFIFLIVLLPTNYHSRILINFAKLLFSRSKNKSK